MHAYLICNVVLVSSIQQRDSVICLYSFSDSFPFKSNYKIFNIVPCAISRSILIFCKWHYNQSFLWLIFHYIYMYHSSFMHSSVNGHLGLAIFRLLPTVNRTAMKIRVHVSF